MTPPARTNAAIAYDGGHDLLVLFGGTGTDGHPMTDTWTFDGQRWSPRALSDSPGAGTAGQMTFDAASGKVVLFDGQTWLWDGDRWTRAQPVHQPPRAGTLSYDPSLGVVVLLAPGAGTHTWGWNGSDWFLINEATTNPGPLEGMAYDVRGARLLGVGGGTWAFIGNRWSRLGDLPGGMAPVDLAMTGSSALNTPVAFGGGTDSGGLSAALWTWDGQTWQLRDAPTGPERRRGAMLGDDAKHQLLVLYGGAGVSGILGDTWTWAPDRGWTRVA